MKRSACGLLAGVLAATSAVAGGGPNRKVKKREALTIEGAVQKPQAFFILQRADLELPEPRLIAPAEEPLRTAAAARAAVTQRVRTFQATPEAERENEAVRKRYLTEIALLEGEERRARLAAISALEEFLQRTPDDPARTPAALLHLAELSFQRSADDYSEAMTRYDASPGDAPAEPPVHQEQAIALARTLTERFPTSTQADSAWYLIAYCLDLEGRKDDARDALVKLLAKYPRSRFAAEANLRLGEYYFEVPGGLEQAAKAYTWAASYREATFHDKALYKLAWTYYRMDRFAEAVPRFLELIELYEKTPGQDVDLRSESVQYVAICLAEEQFGGPAKAEAVLARVADRPYAAELRRTLGDVLIDMSQLKEGISVYKRSLEREPLQKEAPTVRDRLARAYERARDLAAARAAREALIRDCSPGAPWFERWKGDASALRTADELARKARSLLDGLTPSPAPPQLPGPNSGGKELR